MIFALESVARVLGLIAIIHGCEFLILRRKIEEIWAWPILELELGKPFRLLLAAKAFAALNILRILIGTMVLVWPHPLGLWILCAFHVLTLLRWLGTFNGGSDYMTLLLLWTAALGLSFPERFGLVCLSYMTFQLCYSYFKAGWIKLKNTRWRDGSALRGFIESPIYRSSPLTNLALKSAPRARFLAWGVILFEVSFPLSILRPEIAIAYMTLAAFFHLTNAYVFGLNRFFFAWLAGYPALFYIASITLRP